MAGIRQRPNGTWEFKFQRKGLLSGPVYFTFDSREEGEAYAARVEALFDRGDHPGRVHRRGYPHPRGHVPLL